MSIFHSVGDNRLLALEQELLSRRSPEQTYDEEWLENPWAEEGLDASEFDQQPEYPLDEDGDNWDDDEPNIYRYFLHLQPSTEILNQEAPELEDGSILDYPSFYYEGLANLLIDSNRSGKRSHSPQLTQESPAWADSNEFDFDPFASSVSPAAFKSYSPQPDSLIFPDPSLAIATSPSLNLPEIELPESDSPESTAIEGVSPLGEPSYATLSWMLQEGRQQDFPAVDDLSDDADEIFLDIAQTIDITPDAIAKQDNQASDSIS